MSRFTILFLVASLAGCDCGRAPRRPASTTQTAQTPPETPAAVPPFTVTFLPVDTYAIGRDSIVSVEVSLREGLHFEASYPVRVSLRAPGGLGMMRGTFERSDAKVNTDARVMFEVPVLPTQNGSGTIDGTVIFAVCEGERCAPETVPVSLDVTVQ